MGTVEEDFFSKAGKKSVSVSTTTIIAAFVFLLALVGVAFWAGLYWSRDQTSNEGTTVARQRNIETKVASNAEPVVSRTAGSEAQIENNAEPAATRTDDQIKSASNTETLVPRIDNEIKDPKNMDVAVKPPQLPQAILDEIEAGKAAEKKRAEETASVEQKTALLAATRNTTLENELGTARKNSAVQVGKNVNEETGLPTLKELSKRGISGVKYKDGSIGDLSWLETRISSGAWKPGRTSTFTITHPEVQVLRVVDDKNLIATRGNEYVWISNYDTTKLVDGDYISNNQEIFIYVGTRHYTAPNGTPRTIHELRKVTLKEK